jgi:integrase
MLSTSHRLNLLRYILAQAAEDEIIPSNPAADVKLARADEVEVDEDMAESWTFLSLDEQARIHTALAGDPELFIIEFAIASGLRQGEQWNLEDRDLHLGVAEPFMTVRFGSKGKPPKNGKVRRVALSPLAVQAATAWLAARPAYLTWTSTAKSTKAKTKIYKNKFGLVFPTPRGCRRQTGKTPVAWEVATSNSGTRAKLKATGAVNACKPALRAAGIDDRNVRWHDLRHTCASALISGMWGRRWSLE